MHPRRLGITLALLAVACGGSTDDTGNSPAGAEVITPGGSGAGVGGAGGGSASAGAAGASSGGFPGSSGHAGATSSAGTSGKGGAPSSGGAPPAGGNPSSGGSPASGGTSSAGAPSSGGLGGTSSSCPCRLDGIDNFCYYDPADPANAGCAMLVPGGYCNPDGDGNPGTGSTDWVQGYTDFQNACHPACNDGHCSAPSECTSCAGDCASTSYCSPQPSCPNGTCDAGESCSSCPQDCGACPTCTPKTLACTKLGAQTLDDPAFSAFLDNCPAIAKWVTGGTPDWAAMAHYKCQCPGGITVLRMYGPPGNYATGQDLWDARYKVLESASPEQKAAVDFLESDNECDAGHCFGYGTPDPNAAADYASFLSQWIDVAVANGFKPLVLNIAVGNPGGDLSSCSGDSATTFGQLVPAITKAGQAGGGWGYHAYTPQWMQDVSFESYYALRYRQYVGCFPEIAGVSLVLTEGGFDKGGNPDTDGYLANGGADMYNQWLTWFGIQLNGDPYVRGVALFAFAPAGSWSSFRLDEDPGLPALISSPAICP